VGPTARLALLGKPGSGKGTQGVTLAKELGVPLVSIGELLRRRAADRGRPAPELQAMLERGELVPDDLVLAVVRDTLGAMGDGGYILDGFPRTVAQARSEAVPIDAVINLALSDDDARARLLGRASVGRADDANLEAIERRLRAFHSDTEPLIDLYRSRGTLTTVDATASPAEVTSAILEALGAGDRAEGPGTPGS
jgi:adenylate kinase